MPFGIIFQVVLDRFPRANSETLGHVCMLRQERNLEQQKDGDLRWLRSKAPGWPHNHTKFCSGRTVCPLKSGSRNHKDKRRWECEPWKYQLLMEQACWCLLMSAIRIDGALEKTEAILWEENKKRKRTTHQKLRKSFPLCFVL